MTTKKYAFINGSTNTVFTTMLFDELETENPAMVLVMIEGLSSNPKIVEVPSDSEVVRGWSYDGTSFSTGVN